MTTPAAWSPATFRWDFTLGSPLSVFRLKGVEPVYFNGRRARTHNWLQTKHADGAMHEPNFAYVLGRLIELLDPDVYFDVGGFIGYFTVLPMAWTRRTTRIVSFEMHPAYARQIGLNVDQNRHLSTSRVFVLNAGISNEVSYARASNVEAFTLDATSADADEVTIDLLTLDYVAQTLELRPDLVKMDIEGFEAAALQGGTHVLDEVRPTWLFELHSDDLLGRHGETRASMLDRLDRHNYDILELTGDRYDSIQAGPPLRPLDDETRAAVLRRFNSALVAVPRERRHQLDPLIEPAGQ